ncbi:MAG TPA: D-aminoacyl-tRNA deacylase [Candidatus Binatia bacterium]|jgi:D-tyrosyl-tRNA(Tyr) deacylase|nr:D-aminoacyl-tRNA deacylase [Candidatus Binatia bacterium]
MRLLVQRVKEAKVVVHGKAISSIGRGLCLFLGVAKGDDERDVDYLAEKVVRLRIFEDEAEKLNRSLSEIRGDILVVSEFTLYGDCTKGRRPSFSFAAPPAEAEGLYNHFVRRLGELGVKTAKGQFQARMEVALVNDGPVTFIVESRKTAQP